MSAGADPYFLYAASNAGSLLGLACYPWLIEPSLNLSQQARAWKGGFGVMALLVLGCALIRWRQGAEVASLSEESTSENDSLSIRVIARWILLAFIPSSWLLGVTSYITTDLAAIPLLWMIPLAIYLVTYILAFAADSARWTRLASALLPMVVVPLVMVLCTGFVQLFWMPLHLLAFSLGALVCHGQLAASRPGVRRLTAFYLAIALGGVLGGVFNALVAPLVFDRVAEYPLAVVLACLVSPGLKSQGSVFHPRDRLADVILPLVVTLLMAILVTRSGDVTESVVGMFGVMLACGLGLYASVTGLKRPIRFALTTAGVLLASALAPTPGGLLIHRTRNFFGTLRVLDDRRANVHRLLQGSTLHGQQSLDPAGRLEPSTYFARSGPMGQIFGLMNARRATDRASRVAIVGLGAGTLACYAQPEQSWTFYEIDPAVVRIAEDPRYFTYLSDSRARGVAIDLVMGDARIRFRDGPPRGYRLIVLDAFSSDAVPVHLLSREAIAPTGPSWPKGACWRSTCRTGISTSIP